MSIDGDWALQQAIYSALTASAPLKAYIGDPARVFDDVPPGTDFPYLTLGQGTVTDWSTSSDVGFEHRLTLHAWSRYGGRREVKEIMSQVHALLHDANLALVDHTLINLRFVFSDVFRDPDGRTYHGVMRYRAVTEPV